MALLLHLVAFIVLGAVDRYAFRAGDPASRVFPSLLTRGLLLCVLIEAGQVLQPARHARFADLVFNSLGLSVGHMMAPLIGRLDLAALLPVRPRRLLQPAWLRRSLLLVWGLFWSTLILLPSQFVILEDWDSAYHLLIGNEKNGDRPWAGEILYLAIYDRELEAHEVRNLPAPPSLNGDTAARIGMGLLVAYDFTQEGHEVRPQGKLDDPSLRIAVPAGSKWSTGTPAALMLDTAEGGILASVGPAGAVSAAIGSSGAFTVEVRFRPANLHQNGPARIAGISQDTGSRNFTLGQEEHALSLRVRNELNGPNGNRFELRVPEALSADTVHIVATYGQGVSSIFRDGRRLSPTVDLREPAGLLGLGGTRPTAGAVAGLVAGFSLVLAASCCRPETYRASSPRLVHLLVFGYSFILLPLVFGLFLSFRPALSLHIWFGPALILSWLVSRRPA